MADPILDKLNSIGAPKPKSDTVLDRLSAIGGTPNQTTQFNLGAIDKLNGLGEEAMRTLHQRMSEAYNSDQNRQLVKQLGGEVPGVPSRTYGGPGYMGIGTMGQSINEPKRRVAFEALKKKGLTTPQIQLMVDVAKAEKWSGPLSNVGQSGGAIAGSIKGASIGSKFHPVYGTTIGALVGAGVGGFAGKSVQDIVDPYEEFTLKRSTRAGLEEVLFEAGGRVLSKGVGTVFKPLMKKPNVTGRALNETFETVGGHLPPSKLDDRTLVSLAEAVSRGGWGDTWNAFDSDMKRRLAILARDMMPDATPREAGEKLFEMISRTGKQGVSKGTKIAEFDDYMRSVYSDLDQKMADRVISMDAVREVMPPESGGKSFADDLLNWFKTNSPDAVIGQTEFYQEHIGAPIVSTAKIKEIAQDLLARNDAAQGRFLSDSVAKRMQDVMDLPDNISFRGITDMRSHLLEQVRSMKMNSEVQDKLVKKLSTAIDETLNDPKMVEGLPSNLQKLWRDANFLNRHGNELFKDILTAKFAETLRMNPEKAIVEIFKPGEAKKIEAVKNVLTNTLRGTPDDMGKVTWDKLVAAWYDDQVAKSMDPVHHTLNHTRLAARMKSMGNETLGVILNPKQRKAIDNVIEIGSRLEKSRSKGTGLFTKGLQISMTGTAVGLAATGNELGATAAGAIALSPSAYAKLATHPKYYKLLISGMQQKAGSKSLGTLAVRITNALADIDSQHQRAISKAILKLKTQQENKKYQQDKKSMYLP